MAVVAPHLGSAIEQLYFDSLDPLIYTEFVESRIRCKVMREYCLLSSRRSPRL
jgi:hypothetical protein